MQNGIKQNVSLDPSAYPSITAPTLLVHGAMDGGAASVEHARSLHRNAPGAELHVV
jgi:pimeloyl-ACP methyl ester carboxylesterase